MEPLEVPGGILWTESSGAVEAPPLVVIHSGVATARMWDPILPTLASSHRVIRYDARGFGRTSYDSSPFSDVHDLFAVLDAALIESAVLIGASRGGGIAIDAALAEPSRVTGLVTIGSVPSGFPDTVLNDAEQSVSDRLDELDLRGDYQTANRVEAELWAVGTTRSPNDLDPAFLDVSYELHAANLPHAGAVLNRVPPRPVAFGRLGEIRVPALVIVGEHDLSPELAAAEYLGSALPQSRVVLMRKTAHAPSVEHPVEFTRVLLGWLDDNRL